MNSGDINPEDMIMYGDKLIEISHNKMSEIAAELKMFAGMESHITDAMVFITTHMLIDSIRVMGKVAPEGEKKRWENAVLSMVIGSFRHVFKKNILMEDEDRVISGTMKLAEDISHEYRNFIQERLKNTGTIENWDFKFPIRCKVDGKETYLEKSDKTDLYLPDNEMAELSKRGGQQMQLKDEKGTQYWAYFYKREDGTYPLVVQRP